jgi:hypothetical protein
MVVAKEKRTRDRREGCAGTLATLASSKIGQGDGAGDRLPWKDLP